MARKKQPLAPGVADEKQDREFPLLTLHSRVRLIGELTARHGDAILTTKKGVPWTITAKDDLAAYMGHHVVVEGIKVSVDEISADYVGKR